MTALFSIVLSSLAAGPSAPVDSPLPLITTEELSKSTASISPEGWGFVLIDARTRVEFEEQHIDGAINMPASVVAKRLPAAIPDKQRAVVFYCNGPTCTKSQKAARVALWLGYAHVREYNEGLPAWLAAKGKAVGRPLPAVVAASVAPAALVEWRSAHPSAVVLDVRDADEFSHFHIPKAINIPVDEVAARKKELPPGAELCVVDHSGHQTGVASRLLASLGWSRLFQLEGGMVAWRAVGGRDGGL